MSVAAAVVIIVMMAKYKAKTLLGLSVSHNVVPGVWGEGGGVTFDGAWYFSRLLLNISRRTKCCGA